MHDKLNKILQMDCLEYLKELPDKCVDLVLIDEPYGILTGHKIEDGYNLDIAKQVRIEAMRVLKKDGWFVFFSQFPNAWDFGRITFEAGFKPWQGCNEIVWCKRQMSSPFNKVLRIHENIFVFQKGSPKIYNNKSPYEDILIDNAFHGISSFEAIKRYISALRSKKKVYIIKDNYKSKEDIYDFNKNYQYPNKGRQRYSKEVSITSIFSFAKESQMHKNNHNYEHPTVKPILLFRRLLKLFTQKNDIVLDCFMGSGTTALSCIQEGRNFLGCEREEKYIKIANERIENWKADLSRQDKWLKDRGVYDFQSDIQEEIQITDTLL